MQKESNQFKQACKGAFVGCLLGTAAGDSLGLASEGLTPSRRAKLFPNLDRQHFLFGRGMVSDDTDHACFVGQSLLESTAPTIDADLFECRLAHHLRLWLIGAPAGIGLATLKATMKLCIGVPPARSGVTSAGNGPAMRSAILGLYAGDDSRRLAELVHRSTRLTHAPRPPIMGEQDVDRKAEIGALAVAVAAYVSVTVDDVTVDAFREAFHKALAASTIDKATATEFDGLVDRASRSADAGESTLAFAESMGMRRGVSGYVYHTVPAVLQTWLRYPGDFRAGIVDIIRAGGDTDSTAAILGAIVGARVGPEGIPAAWLDGIWEWPRSVAWMRELGEALATSKAGSPSTSVPLASWQLPLRNLIFTSTVLAHAFRRALPPY